MSMVLVVDHQRRRRAPVHPGRARHLLTRGRAAVYRRFPFTLILREGEPTEEPEPLRLKIDPGSKTTGPRRGQRCDRAGGVGRRVSRIAASK